MKVLFVPNLGAARRVEQPKWGADFFADAFIKHSEHDVTVEYTLDNIGDYDVVWVHNVANLLKGASGRINLVKTMLGKHPPMVGGVRGSVGFGEVKHYLRFFDAIHTSNYDLTKMAKRSKVKSYTIISGVDLEKFKPAPAPEGFCIGWAGDTRKKMKNIDTIKALLEPTRYATKENYIPHDEMPERFYHKINALVHPSSHEGSCRVITEAAACGLPIICTNVGHNKMIVNPNFMFTLYDDPIPQIKKRINLLRDNPELAQIVGSHNRENVEKFSWDRVIGRCDRVIGGITYLCL